jgi:NADPH2:quinone reductase
MPKAILVHETGGPEKMHWDDVAVSDPGPGQARIRHTAVGLNYIDVYFRTGLYPAPSMPLTPGLEGAGVVEAVGDGVSGLAVGDRVAYAAPPVGAYAEERCMPAEKLVKIPDGIDDRQAAAMMLQGMTVEYLMRRTHAVSAGETILFHAAAGGVGLIACQWAKHLGATVIGTVSSYTREDFHERVMELTDGKGVPVVYDSVGETTFMRSLDCLQPRGMMVSFGQSSGKVDPVDIGILSAKGSLFLTRPTLMTYTASREDLELSTGRLFEVVGSGAVKIEVNQTFPLAEAAAAHVALEGRKTTGSTVLLP